MTMQGKTPEVIGLLSHIHEMFRPLQIAHVALHRHNNGQVSIAEDEVFPATNDSSYCIPFEEGKSVAGLVFRDSITRYVPRIFLPAKYRWIRGIFMPHALRVKFETLEDDSEPVIQSLEMEPNVLAPSPDGKFSFDSFLSIPVSSPADGTCIAVLSLDFHHCNTLKKADIALAHYVGSSIGRIVK